ncbi:DegT/DnrJ/EryC1/StrS family aminotransferase [Streptococcus parasuis]
MAFDFSKKVVPFENKVWLASPTMHGEELKFMKEAYDTNWMTTAGSNINALEEQIKDYTKSENVVALSSGTSALHLAMKLAGIKKGDFVFCSDVTFSATVNPVI